MSGQELLYVAFKDEHKEEHFDHCISYAIYLSKLLSKPLRVLLLNRHAASRLDRTISSVAAVSPFPHTQAEALAADVWEEDHSLETTRVRELIADRCGNEGVAASVHCDLEASAAAITRFLHELKVDMLLLSPKVVESRRIHKRLVKTSPHPVVSMSRGAAFPAAQVQAE